MVSFFSLSFLTGWLSGFSHEFIEHSMSPTPTTVTNAKNQKINKIRSHLHAYAYANTNTCIADTLLFRRIVE